MKILKPVRAVAGRVLGPQIGKTIRRYFRRPMPTSDAYVSSLSGRRGLEIGGPSEMFDDSGPLPVYSSLGTLDNCLYSDRTLWTGDVKVGQTFEFHPRRQKGTQFICEASDLGIIRDSSYDCVLASHCLEHVANPLRALEEWRRVLKDDGLLLLVLPHKDGTFDWRRPTTTLPHMIEDYEKNIGENDLTHVPEILALHDLTKDKPAGSPEEFRRRCLDNVSNRAIHHHVFDTLSALKMVDYAAYQVLRVDTLKPFNIIILAARCTGIPNNASFLEAGASYRHSSPFESDRLLQGLIQ